MLSRFLHNWPYKLLAIAIAVALRVYVADAMNPRSIKTMTVPLIVRGVPDNLVVTDATQNVVVQIGGSPSVIDSFSPSDIAATVDVDKAHPGPNPALPITISIAPGLRGQVEKDSMTPNGAAVTLDTKSSLTMKLNADFTTTAPAGYQYSLPAIKPEFARVDGPQSTLNTISRLVVFLDMDSGGPSIPTTIDDTADIIALNSHNAQVVGVDITPKQAHVIIPIEKVGEFKSLVVSPQIIGSPKYPLRVSQVDVSPTTMIISGPGQLLSQTSVIMTEPIDVSQQKDTYTETVKLDLPPGLTALQSSTVEVTVHLTNSQTTGNAPNGLTLHTTVFGRVN